MLVKKMLLCIKIYIAENYYKIYTKNEPKQNKGENDSIHVVKRTAHKNIKRGIYIPAQEHYLYFSLCKKKKNYSAKKFISSV